MTPVSRFVGWVTIFLIVGTSSAQNERPKEDEKRISHHILPTASICEARTINYITHSLPQLCLTNTWRGSSPSQEVAQTSVHAPDSSDASASNLGTSTGQWKIAPTGAHMDQDESGGETEASSFLSFDAWKEMMLRRTGQDPQDLRSRRVPSEPNRERTPPDLNRFGLGEEDEISLDFQEYLHPSDADKIATYPTYEREVTRSPPDDLVERTGDSPSLHRSKDAGKTCKERFSYSSFDAGATILKTGRGTKNAKAILVENKDSYMLLECAVDNKFVIVELSDDILIDTMVLANFEFFSSMIRHFRVSVSDRYPVKMDRWRDIGTFEARNSRDIQAFLVENPQIWAKYVRIEFLTQYGNEFYCPVSLLRVHGSRMLDSWKDTETSRDDEALSEEDVEKFASISDNSNSENTHGDRIQLLADNAAFWGYSTWSPSYDHPSLYVDNGTCHADVYITSNTMQQDRKGFDDGETGVPSPGQDLHARQENDVAASLDKGIPSADNTMSSSAEFSPTSSMVEVVDSRQLSQSSNLIANTTTTNHTQTDAKQSTSTVRSSTTTSSGPKHRNSGTHSAPVASPTVQEGFFNAITKRLHHVESNLTLSLQYLEDSSRYMQEALQKVDQKQASRVSAFIEHLDRIVLDELRGAKDQYEQIWQSTVIALETQKEQSDRDIVALGTRLNLLADEVVFQKRMAIMQAVLLLCCLFLVIFSRGVPIPYLAPLLEPNLLSPASGALASRSDRTESFSFDGLENSYDTATEQRKPSQFNSIADPSPLRSSSDDITHSHKPSSAERNGLTHATMISGSACEDRICPPMTANLSVDSSLADVDSSDFELQSVPGRRLQSHPIGYGRKPLPALPEHPSPEKGPDN